MDNMLMLQGLAVVLGGLAIPYAIHRAWRTDDFIEFISMQFGIMMSAIFVAFMIVEQLYS